jgi:hypothetical protein
MNWSCLVLKQRSDGLIEDAWKLAWEVARSTNSVDYSNALFERNGPGRSEITIFFPPSAAVLAMSFGAKRCDKPPVSGLSLLVGDERAWTIHFGGKPGRVPVIERLFRSSRPGLLGPAEPPANFEPTHPSGAFEPTQPSPLQ